MAHSKCAVLLIQTNSEYKLPLLFQLKQIFGQYCWDFLPNIVLYDFGLLLDEITTTGTEISFCKGQCRRNFRPYRPPITTVLFSGEDNLPSKGDPHDWNSI